VINVVTKSGTNEFHGGAFEYFRDESLNSNDPVTKANESRRGQPNKRPALRINQFGARVGGPISRNKAFFFITYDGQRSNVPQVLDVPNLVLTPHIASAGEATRDAMGILAIDNAAAVLAGHPALTPVR